MSGNYRYWCGECSYRTAWVTESEVAGVREIHYASKHPGIVPGGRVESNHGGKSGGGAGCLGLVGGLVLILVLASMCSGHSQQSAPPPPAPTVSHVAR
ncbi:hypothetical protein [Amycolatopsis benzoatilytica]|uniref:hypothetical protein n=1 Tax=Amycolatopsis benzoatilytica TaxID=346045 RepID=UPI00037ED44E|nr:hypothetical protein [Amycolatopsis benzoatilytica]